jgi:hypothetical protein
VTGTPTGADAGVGLCVLAFRRMRNCPLNFLVWSRSAHRAAATEHSSLMTRRTAAISNIHWAPQSSLQGTDEFRCRSCALVRQRSRPEKKGRALKLHGVLRLSAGQPSLLSAGLDSAPSRLRCQEKSSCPSIGEENGPPWRFQQHELISRGAGRSLRRRIPHVDRTL